MMVVVRTMIAKRGVFDARSRNLGIKSEAFDRFNTFAEDHHEIYRFGTTIFLGQSEFSSGSETIVGHTGRVAMLPTAIASEVTAIARKRLESYLKKYEISQTRYFAPDQTKGNGTFWPSMRHTYDEAWKVKLKLHAGNAGSSRSIIVDDQKFRIEETSSGFIYSSLNSRQEATPLAFYPRDLNALHELGHIERTKPGKLGRADGGFRTLMIEEVGPSLEEIILADEIYKEVMGIPINETVDYPYPYVSNFGPLNPGELANYFRPLVQELGSAEAAIMSREGMQFIRRYFK